MSLLLSLISTLLNSISNVYRKKALSLSKISSNSFFFIWQRWGLIIALILIALNQFNIHVLSNYYIMIFVLINIGFSLANMTLTQNIYKQEKMSVLMPYEQLNKIISIVIMFIFFHEATLTSFIIAIITVFVIMGFSYDFKNHSIPRNLKWMLIVQTNVAIRAIIIAYTLKHITSIDLFVCVWIISAIIVFISILFQHKLKEIKECGKDFYIARSVPSILWWINSLISFYLLSKLWLIYTNLLSFLAILFTIIFSYFMFWEKPSKKDLLLSTIICLLVWVGFYFK